MSEPIDGKYTLTLPVVMSFPQLFEPKAFMENGKPKGDPVYKANFNFPADSEDLKHLKALATKLARAQWPDKPFFLTTQEGVKIPEILFPFTSGDKLADDRKAKGKNDGEHTRGKVVLTAKSKYEVRLSYIENGRVVDCETEAMKTAAKSKFYAGVEVLAQITLVPYEKKGANGKPGVTAYLNMVLSTGKGAKIAGGASASETFKGYVGAISTENPMGDGMADDDLGDII